MIDIKEYIGIRVSINNTDGTHNIVGALSPTFSIVKGQVYTLQFKLANVNTGNNLDYMMLFDGVNKQGLPNIDITQFKTIGMLKVYKDDLVGYEEKLCYLRFVANFSSNNVKLSIARRMVDLDRNGDTAFFIRQVKLARGSLLDEWSERPNETPKVLLKSQSQFIQEANVIKASVESVENEVIENKGSIEILDKSVTLAVTSANKAQETANGAYEYASGEIEILAGQINNKVTADDVMSLIQQNPTDVQFWFNKISPSVTINQSGITIHNGSIACDAITTPSGHDPIIRIFKNGNGYCSIDATKLHESGGFGNAIRLKLDSNNYVRVGNGSVSFFMTGSSNNEAEAFVFRAKDGYAEIETKGGKLRFNRTELTFAGRRVMLEGAREAEYEDRINYLETEIKSLREELDNIKKLI